MMKISIITLFPDFIKTIFDYSMLKKAIIDNVFELEIVNLREFGCGKNKQVDDYQYGGGPGMVLMVPVLVKALESVLKPTSYVVLLTPQGKTFQQALALDLSDKKHLILIAGHYEGFDERIREFVDAEISIGDYVLTGGELPALIITEAVVRLLPHLLNNDSHIFESFQDGLLDYPVYTRPQTFRDCSVPAILLSGNHKKIQAWRLEQSIIKTKIKRPDLFKKYQASLTSIKHPLIKKTK